MSQNPIVFSKNTKLALALGVIAGAICLGVISYRVFVIKLVRVPTGAMANTVIPGDHLTVKRRFFGSIRRGDIIVFTYLGDANTSYIARVIGLPGESILVRDTHVFIDSHELSEERVFVKRDDFSGGLLEEISTEGDGPYRVFYLSRDRNEPQFDETPYATTEPFRIPAEHYFVMGDNRDNSEDSRFRGPVGIEGVIGKAKMIYFSAGRTSSTPEQEIRWNRIFRELQ